MENVEREASSVSSASDVLRQQYRDASNLNARIELHKRFSTNAYGWHPWVLTTLRSRPVEPFSNLAADKQAYGLQMSTVSRRCGESRFPIFRSG